MANVTFKNVYKFYEKNMKPAVSDFNLEIENKEFVVFVGPSGCGKSTTLRMIAGLEQITFGEIAIDGRVVNEIEPKDRNIAMVFQNYALYPHMTVYNNMAFGLKSAKIPKEVRDESKITVRDKNGNKLNPFVLFFTKIFARTPLEERDEKGNIVYNDDGTPKFVVKTKKDGSIKLNKDGKPVYKMRPYHIDEYLGPVVRDESGAPKLIAKLHTEATLKKVWVLREETDENGNIVCDENGNPVYVTVKDYKAKTPLERVDESGNIVRDESGNPVYVVKMNKDGTEVTDNNGNPVYEMRAYTEEEIAAGLLPDKLDKNGKPVYERRRLTEDEIKERINTPRTNKNGDIIYKKRKYTNPEIKEKVEEAARTLDITQFLTRKPGQLSGGQRQRVAIGRAIVRKPKVFLFDEPLSNLDAKLRNQMRAEIIALRKKIDTTFVYVTHDQVEAMTLGDRIVIMKDGVVQQVGTPSELFEKPANLFVAGFIGSPQMNFFDAELKKEKDTYVAYIGATKIQLSDAAVARFKELDLEEKPIVIGVRPEHIGFVKEKEGQNVLCANVSVAEMMGSELYIHTLFNGENEVVVRVPTLFLDKGNREVIDNLGEVSFKLVPEALHIFDKETEENLI